MSAYKSNTRFLEQLEITILTYNRENYIYKTLSFLQNSILNFCKINVLNNASSDNTLSVIKSFEKHLPFLNIITNNCNIGLVANFVKALESSDSEYLWILCDDDDLNLNDLSDVIEVIEKGEIQLIQVGAHPEKWSFGATFSSPKELLEKGYHFFKFGSFWPCNIYKTSLVRELIVKVYDAIYCGYAQWPILGEVYKKNYPIYISKNQLVVARQESENYNLSRWLTWWLQSCSLLGDKESVRSAFFDHVEKNDLPWFIEQLKNLSTLSLIHERLVRNFVNDYFEKDERKMFDGRFRVSTLFRGK